MAVMSAPRELVASVTDEDLQRILDAYKNGPQHYGKLTVEELRYLLEAAVANVEAAQAARSDELVDSTPEDRAVPPPFMPDVVLDLLNHPDAE